MDRRTEDHHLEAREERREADDDLFRTPVFMVFYDLQIHISRLVPGSGW